MKKLLLSVAATAALLAGLAAAKEKLMTVAGWVSDENCGAQHTRPGGGDCIRKCLRGGQAIGHPEWKPQRMVFVADKDKRIWVVENPAALKDQEGYHVEMTVGFDLTKKSLRVERVVRAGESRNTK